MGSDAKKAFNAVGRDELLWFDPKTLTIVKSDGDDGHPLADPDRLAEDVDENLVLNIMAHGIKVPIIVRLNGKSERTDLPIVEVVDGRQRVRASLEANKRLTKQGAEPVRVPGVRTRGSDADMLAVVIFSNELRKADGPLARARKAKRLMDLGKSIEEVGIVFGAHWKTVEDWLALLECDTKVQEAVEVGKVSAAIARKLAKLPREEQKTKLKEMVDAGTTRGRAAEAAVAPRRGGGNTAPATEASVVPSRRALRRLWEELTRQDGSEEVRAVLAFCLDGSPLTGALGKVWRASQKEQAA